MKPQEGTKTGSHKKAQKSQKQLSDVHCYFVIFVPFCG